MTPDLVALLAGLPERPSLERIWSVLPDARLVGGVVRDLIAGRPVADLDLATPEPPDAVLARLRADGIKVVPTGLEHGTVTAVLDGLPYEITTLRRDVETDGRHAIVAWTGDWREDAARRDFTINAMSLDRDGTLHDHFGGAADLAAGRVRFVGDAVLRIDEDALRILRYFRFQARYGRGAPDEAAERAIGAAVERLQGLSAERIWSELRRLLELPDPADTLLAMRRLGVLQRLLPDGIDAERVATLVRHEAPADPILRLAALSTGAPDAVAARLRLSNADAARLSALQAGPVPDPGMDDDSLRRLLADVPTDMLTGRSWLAGVSAGIDAAGWQVLRDRLRDIAVPVFPLAGRDAVAAGLPPGPAVGQALRAARDWWLAGGCHADRDACLARLAGR